MGHIVAVTFLYKKIKSTFDDHAASVESLHTVLNFVSNILRNILYKIPISKTISKLNQIRKGYTINYMLSVGNCWIWNKYDNYLPLHTWILNISVYLENLQLIRNNSHICRPKIYINWMVCKPIKLMGRIESVHVCIPLKKP